MTRGRGGHWAIAIVAGMLAIGGARGQVQVNVPSLDAPQGLPVALPAFWLPAGGGGAAPAWVLLHGCGGPYGRSGALSARMRGYAEMLNGLGHHVLVPDSLGPRGERELCTQRIGTRRVTQRERRRDALGALQWLAAQPGVDPARLGLIGWSNGGTTVLAALNLNHVEVAAARVQPSAAVAFYPGCIDEAGRGFASSARLLLLLGGADDWTPAAPCLALADGSAPPRPEVVVFDGAHHGFDTTAAVQLRRDVSNGVQPGQGVHVGGDPAAREASRERLQRFARDAFERP